MTTDIASLKMAYEAERDWFLGWYERSRLAEAPAEVPTHLRRIYESARKRGMRETLQFDYVQPANAPIELDGQFGEAWKLGYEDGRYFGGHYGLIIANRVLE